MPLKVSMRHMQVKKDFQKRKEKWPKLILNKKWKQ